MVREKGRCIAMNINLLGGTASSYDLLKQGIDASNTRAEVISNNMANVNTKNYKRFGVVFEENLKASGNSSVSMKKTKTQHLSVKNVDGNIEVVQDKSTSMREDGNNVDLEYEKVEQAANTMKYNALIQQANSKLSNVKYVISGGN